MNANTFQGIAPWSCPWSHGSRTMSRSETSRGLTSLDQAFGNIREKLRWASENSHFFRESAKKTWPKQIWYTACKLGIHTVWQICLFVKVSEMHRTKDWSPSFGIQHGLSYGVVEKAWVDTRWCPPSHKLVYNPNNYRYNPHNPSYSTYKPT